jgi:hypothetical protein
MAKHDVSLKVGHEIPIAGKDVEFYVSADSKAFGRVRISRGAIDWFPRYVQKGGYELSWEEFDSLMKAHGRKKA